MEKYTVFDDRQNGSNPFRPIRGKRRSFGAKIILFLAMVVLVPLRVVVGTLAMLCAWLFSFVPVRAVRRLSDKLFLRLVLLSLGFWTVGSRLANHRKIGIGARRRSRRSGDEESELDFGNGISRGHVVVSNLSSALEVLLLSFWLRLPQFAFPVLATKDSNGGEAKVVVLGLFDALQQACSSQATLNAEHSVPLVDAVKNSKGPLVVFAEGCRTNGSCVMPFQLFDATEEDTVNGKNETEQKTDEVWGRKLPVHILAVTYDFNFFNPAGDAAVSLPKLLWGLATEVSNSATGVHLHSHFIKGATIRCDRVQLQEWLANIQQNVRTVREIDATFYPAFWKLYHNQGSGGSKFALEGGGGAGQMPARREKTAAEKERERFF